MASHFEFSDEVHNSEVVLPVRQFHTRGPHILTQILELLPVTHVLEETSVAAFVRNTQLHAFQGLKPCISYNLAQCREAQKQKVRAGYSRQVYPGVSRCEMECANALEVVEKGHKERF